MRSRRRVSVPFAQPVFAGAVLCMGLALSACSVEATTESPASKPSVRAKGELLSADAYDLRGSGVARGAVVPIADVLAEPAAFLGKELRVSGQVDTVCKAKGCWMKLGDPERNVRVTFKDYGFFVPLDCEGREVIVEGVLSEKVESIEEVKHYLEDAGKPDEAAKVTAPRKVYSFVADGVALKK